MYRSRLAFALTMAVSAAILLPSSLPAQITFQRTYGGTDGDEGRSAQQTTDSGYIIAGSSWSFGSGAWHVYLIKTNPEGDTLWTRVLGGTGSDLGYSVQQTTDSGYVIAGTTSSSGTGAWDVYLIKTDPHGDTLWTRAYGGASDDQGYSVQQTADSGYIIAGTTMSFGAGFWDVYLIKTSANGDTLWTKTYGGDECDVAQSVRQTADSGYIIAGYTYSFGSRVEDVYLVKTNTKGETLWTRTFGGDSFDWGYSVQQTADDGYVIAGATISSGAGGYDVYLVRVDSHGETLWTRAYGGVANDEGYSVQLTADGGYVVAGYSQSFGAGNGDAYLIKTDANGEPLWTKTFGGTGWDQGNSVQQTTDGGFLIAGKTNSFGAGADDVYLIKTDSLGNVAVAEPKTSPTRAQVLSLSCEPNPCRGATTIRTSYIVLRSSLSIYDASGCLIHSEFGLRASPFRLDLRSMPAGAYFVRLNAGNEHATARIVLQR